MPRQYPQPVVRYTLGEALVSGHPTRERYYRDLQEYPLEPKDGFLEAPDDIREAAEHAGTASGLASSYAAVGMQDKAAFWGDEALAWSDRRDALVANHALPSTVGSAAIGITTYAYSEAYVDPYKS